MTAECSMLTKKCSCTQFCIVLEYRQHISESHCGVIDLCACGKQQTINHNSRELATLSTLQLRYSN